MESDIIFDGKKYISSSRAAALFGYTQDYVGQLIREKKIDAKMIGRGWFVSTDSLMEYQRNFSNQPKSGKLFQKGPDLISASREFGPDLPIIPPKPSKTSVSAFDSFSRIFASELTSKIATGVISALIVAGGYWLMNADNARNFALGLQDTGARLDRAIGDTFEKLAIASREDLDAYVTALEDVGERIASAPIAMSSLAANVYGSLHPAVDNVIAYVSTAFRSQGSNLAAVNGSVAGQSAALIAPTSTSPVQSSVEATPPVAANNATTSPASSTIYAPLTNGVSQAALDARLAQLASALQSQIASTQKNAQISVENTRSAMNHLSLSNFGNAKLQNGLIQGGNITDASISATDLAVSGPATFTGLTTGSIKIGYANIFTPTIDSLAIGNGALAASTTAPGGSTAIGYLALASQTTGWNNTAIGAQSGMSLTTGDHNTFVGRNSGASVTYGDSNVFVGNLAGGTLCSGCAGDIFIGRRAGNSASSSGSVYIGNDAGVRLTGDFNIVLGAGTADDYTYTGGGNIIIGNNIEFPTTAPTNQLDIGNLIYGTGIDTMGTDLASGNIGIGTTTPTARLAVTGSGTGTGRAFAVANSSNIEQVTILDNGKVGIGTTSPSSALHVNGGLTLSGNQSAAAWGVSGIRSNSVAATFTDTSTLGNGTVTAAHFTTLGQPTFDSLNSNVTATQAATLYIAGAPATTGNTAISFPFALKADGQGIFSVGGAGTSMYASANKAAVQGIYVDTVASGATYGVFGTAEFRGSASGVGRYKAGQFWGGTSGGSSGTLSQTPGDLYAGSIVGVDAHAYHGGSGTIATLFPVRGQITNYSSSISPVTDSATFFSDNPLLQTGNSIDTYAGLWVKGGDLAGGTIAHRKGVRIDSQAGAGNSDVYGLWVESDPSYFGGGLIASSSLTVTKDRVDNGDADHLAQMVVRSVSDSNLRLLLGYNTTSDNGFIQAFHHHVGATSLILQSLGGNVGIGTSTPTAQLSTTGTVRFSNFGAGTLQTDASGNVTVSSDERLKDVHGSFTRGLSDILGLSPILYSWNATSGLDMSTINAGFSAQNVQLHIPEAVNTDSRGYLTLSDRPILAAAVNAIKELNLSVESIQARASSTYAISTSTVSAMAQDWLLSLGVTIENTVARFVSVIADTIFAHKATFDEAAVGIASNAAAAGLTTYDHATGQSVCMYVENGVVRSAPGACGSMAPAAVASSTSGISSSLVPSSPSSSGAPLATQPVSIAGGTTTEPMTAPTDTASSTSATYATATSTTETSIATSTPVIIDATTTADTGLVATSTATSTTP